MAIDKAVAPQAPAQGRCASSRATDLHVMAPVGLPMDPPTGLVSMKIERSAVRKLAETLVNAGNASHPRRNGRAAAKPLRSATRLACGQLPPPATPGPRSLCRPIAVHREAVCTQLGGSQLLRSVLAQD